MAKCLVAAFFAAIAAAFTFLVSALFDHSPSTNIAVLGLVVTVGLATVASRGVVLGLVVVGFVWFGLSHQMTGYLESLKIAGWVMAGLVCLGVVAWVVGQAPSFLQSFKPRSRAEYQADLNQLRQHNQARQERADQARFAAERQQLEAQRKGKERDRRIGAAEKQRRLYRKHYERHERYQRRLNLLSRLGLVPPGAAGPLDQAPVPEPADWSDPVQRVAYERAVMQRQEAEQMRLADLALMSAAQEQRQREERNQRWIERCHRLGLNGIAPVAQSLPASRAFVADLDGKRAQDDAGRVVEFIEGEGDTFIVIEPDEMKAEAERGGYEWQWTRKPAIVAHPVKKARHKPPSHQGGGPVF